jgi:hypothetical protein
MQQVRTSAPRTVAKQPTASARATSDQAYAQNLIHAVCCLAGSASFVDDQRTDLREEGVLAAIKAHDTPKLFDWMVRAFSFQGIADAIASDYLERHGGLTWAAIAADLDHDPSCPKPRSYWQFYDCGYRKLSGTCNEPEHFPACPLPLHPLRNGRLNQTAYSLFLFIRDLADGDLVTWIDRRLADADDPADPDRLVSMGEALVGPLRHVYGVSDKVLMMTLSGLLLASHKPAWTEAGAHMIAIDTLVHNFLHRTGILHRFGADHPYGLGCYRPTGCADLIRSIASTIDARQFNRSFPKVFPRFVQHAIWRYCAQSYFNVCNGNRIDDRQACQNGFCQLYRRCDRKPLVNIAY